MYVDVDLSRNPAALELREPGDFTAFKLVTHGEGELAPAIADISRVDGQAHVYLRPDAIRVLAGDRVTLELSPYDLTKGRITYRHK